MTSAAFQPDLAYGDDERLKLDVYSPRDATGAPVLVFVHGGSWWRSDKSHYGYLANPLVEAGYVVVVVGFRLAPKGVFPDFVEDAACAMRWVVDNVTRFGGAPSRICLMGHSSGAQIGALLCLDPSYLTAVGLDRVVVRAFVGQAGYYDFIDLIEKDEAIRTAMGPREQWPRTQPIRFVDGRQPPMLLQQGGGDVVIPSGNADGLAARISEKGGSVQVRHYPSVDHRGIVEVVGEEHRSREPRVFQDILAFLRQVNV